MSKRNPSKSGDSRALPSANGNAATGARFELINPQAHEVFVAGSFNDWNPGATPLTDLGHGHWVKDVSLPPGRYEYQFVVDGCWVQDRAAKESVVNPFGGLNSVLVVPAPQFTVSDLGGTAKRINPKWEWHYRALLRAREQLLESRGERIKEASEPSDTHAVDSGESAKIQFDHDQALSELSAQQESLYEVEEALRRILVGTYGKCEATGKLIPSARLRAIPWARFSTEVEATLERHPKRKAES